MPPFVRRIAQVGAAIPARIEDAVAACAVVLCASIASYEVFSRLLVHKSIPAAGDYIQHLVLVIAMVTGIIASRERAHLCFSLIDSLPVAVFRRRAGYVASCVTISVLCALSIDAFFFARYAFDPAMKVGFVPVVVLAWLIPAAFVSMGLHTLFNSRGKDSENARTGWKETAAGACGIPLFLLTVHLLHTWPHATVWGASTLLIVSLFFGTPIFAVIGGCAQLLLFVQSGALGVVSNEVYTMCTGPLLPTLPLFTCAGFILSETNAPRRLVALFRSFFGWIPGGIGVMAVVVSTFFTTFTGASGVTILALGGLLFITLQKAGYSRDNSTGMLTAGGSLGLLFPPSLPVILYGIVAQVDIRKIYTGGIIPGFLMMIAVIVIVIRSARKNKVGRYVSSWPERLRALWHAGGELLIPLIIIAGFFGGITTIVESSAIAVVIALGIQSLIHHDIDLTVLKRIVRKSLPVTGGVLIILAMANALSYYLVDAGVPRVLTRWCLDSIESKYLFLLSLNAVLLAAGCIMDIFSATMILGPLVVSIASAYGIDPVHTGIIFLANLELGYLTPPVGLNLFLASYRFNYPLSRIYRTVLPYLLILLVTVLSITYMPFLSTWLVDIFF